MATPGCTVHTKCWGAHGELGIAADISRYTKAKMPQVGAKIPRIARLSTAASKLSAADAKCDMGSFAL